MRIRAYSFLPQADFPFGFLPPTDGGWNEAVRIGLTRGMLS